jgi:hypothetical protein
MMGHVTGLNQKLGIEMYDKETLINIIELCKNEKYIPDKSIVKTMAEQLLTCSENLKKSEKGQKLS